MALGIPVPHNLALELREIPVLMTVCFHETLLALQISAGSVLFQHRLRIHVIIPRSLSLSDN